MEQQPNHPNRTARPVERAATVVSITPVAVECDSRTFKQAATLTAHGFRSIVYEGVASGRDRERLPFELISPRNAGSDTPTEDGSEIGRTGLGLIYRGWRELRARARTPVLLFLMFLVYLLAYVWRYVMRPFMSLPRADVYVLHEFSTHPAVRLRAALCRAPIVYDALDFYSEIEPAQVWPAFDRRWLAPFHRRLEQACIRSAIVVLTVSGRLASLLRDRFGVEAMVLRNLHDPRLDRDDTADLRARLGLLGDAFLVPVVGNRKHGQALLAALDALTHLPARVYVAFVGQGYEHLVGGAAARGLTDRVHMPGHLALDEIVPALRAVDASLILYYSRSPNYEAALPNGLFQCIAAELPILYPDLPEIANLMRAWNVGLAIDPQDARSIAEGVSRQMTTPDGAGAPEAYRKVARVHEWAQKESEFVSAVTRVLQADSSRQASPRRGERAT